jgi:hypothetical protein
LPEIGVSPGAHAQYVMLQTPLRGFVVPFELPVHPSVSLFEDARPQAGGNQ